MRVICLDSSAPVQCVKLRSRFKQEQNEPKPAMKRTLCQPYLFKHIVFFASNLIIQCGVRVRFYFLSILFGFPTFYFPLLFSFSFYFFLSHTYTFFSLLRCCAFSSLHFWAFILVHWALLFPGYCFRFVDYGLTPRENKNKRKKRHFNI